MRIFYIIGLLLLSTFLPVPANATTEYKENFENLTIGLINGQDGWAASNNGHSNGYRVQVMTHGLPVYLGLPVSCASSTGQCLGIGRYENVGREMPASNEGVFEFTLSGLAGSVGTAETSLNFTLGSACKVLMSRYAFGSIPETEFNRNYPHSSGFVIREVGGVYRVEYSATQCTFFKDGIEQTRMPRLTLDPITYFSFSLSSPYNVGAYVDNINTTFFPSTSSKLPIILLPGLAGSWTDNFFDLFLRPSPIPHDELSLVEESRNWLFDLLDSLGYLPHTWQLPKTILPELGYTIHKCPYDWRNTNLYSAEHYLVPCIDTVKQETGAQKVNILAHSMGGLVARAYIQNDALYKNDVENLFMYGTPNHGSTKAFAPWEDGDLLHGLLGNLGEVSERAVLSRLISVGTSLTNLARVQYVHTFFPSMQELLPTMPYLESGGALRPTEDMVWRNSLLSGLATTNVSRLIDTISSHVFAGEGYETANTIKVTYPNPDNPFGLPYLSYPDGTPLSYDTSIHGDTTVLSEQSARITEASVPFTRKTKNPASPLSLEHANLPNAFIQETLSLLGATATTTEEYAPRLPDAILVFSLASPADLLIIDPQGRKLGFDELTAADTNEIPASVYSGKNEMEMAAIINPEPGNYRVLVTGNGAGEFHTGISYARQGCDTAVSHDNTGTTTKNSVTAFTVRLTGECSKGSADFTLDALLDIDPNTLNISSRGKPVTAYLELPDSYDINAVDRTSLLLNNTVMPLSARYEIDDHNNNGISDLMIKFERGAVVGILSEGDNILTLSGTLANGTAFSGTDTIVAIRRE